MSVKTYDFGPPKPTTMGDHDVDLHGTQLAGRHVALMVCGGIAAFKAPLLARALRRQGAEVTAFVSKEGLRYVTADALEWSTTNPVIDRLTPHAEHLSDGAPFDAYLIAPATYNTINKTALGIADGVITATLASALGRMERGEASVLVAPTMHGTMHNSILTGSLRRLNALGVRIIPPRDAYGKDNIPHEAVLVAEVCRALSRSPLKGRRVLVTGGTMTRPAGPDHALIPDRSSDLGHAVATELYLRGAYTLFVHGALDAPCPEFLPRREAVTAMEHDALVKDLLSEGDWAAAVFTAGLPRLTAAGDALRPTPASTVTREAGEVHPAVHVVTMADAEETASGDTSVSWTIHQTGTAGARPAHHTTQGNDAALAAELADHLERALRRT